MRRFVHPREEIVEAIERIYRYRMTTTSGGNLSIRDENDDVWITPARVDKGSLRAADIIRCTPGGETAGPHKPSSEYPFHRAIYHARADIRAIVHAHPVGLVAFSIVRKTPNPALFPQAHVVCGKVGMADYALPGSERLGANIAAVFAGGADCVILENHGVVVGGADLAQAFARFETLEFCAKTVIKAGQLGTVRYLSDEQLAGSRAAAAVMDSFEPGPAGIAEKEVRQSLAEFVRRGYRQRLFICTEGSFSARLGNDEFIITNRGIDRCKVTPEDLALVRHGRCEAGQNPSGAAAIHRAIYQRHSSVGAIVNAMPVNATAFAVTGAALDARTIPESYLFLRDVATAPYESHLGDVQQLAEVVSPESPVLLIQNFGALVLGTSILDAFDRLEVLEATAEALINSRPLGQLHPMGDAALGELLTAFFPKPGKAAS
jgi:L-fuculose-phosphate aldolase